MSPKAFAVVCCLVVFLLSGAAWAQSEPERKQEPKEEKVFNLTSGETADIAVEDEDAGDAPSYLPQLETGKLEFSLSLGFMTGTDKLLEHSQIIYKARDDFYYFGDVVLKGKSAFTPFLRFAYNLTPWFGLEARGSLTFGEYNSEVTNRIAVNPESPADFEEDPKLLEFDPERRSYLIFLGNLNAMWYFLNMDGNGEGRWHPYLTGGVGSSIYNLDSNYTDGSASSLDLNVGFGIRLIADDLISVRFDIAQHFHEIQFSPSQYFDVYNEGTVRVPVYEYDRATRSYGQVQEYKAQTMSPLVWSFGIQASF